MAQMDAVHTVSPAGEELEKSVFTASRKQASSAFKGRLYLILQGCLLVAQPLQVASIKSDQGHIPNNM